MDMKKIIDVLITNKVESDTQLWTNIMIRILMKRNIFYCYPQPLGVRSKRVLTGVCPHTETSLLMLVLEKTHHDIDHLTSKACQSPR